MAHYSAYLHSIHIFGVELYTLISLFIVAIAAGFIDSIAGGGGLLTLPALLLSGLDPMLAFGTNKLQASCGTTSAAITFARQKLVSWRIALQIIILSMTASILGALCVGLFPVHILQKLVPFLLGIVLIYFTFSPKIKNEDSRAKISTFVFCFSIIPCLGFYDGVFGPGVGSFFMFGFSSLLGFGAIKAMASTKIANASSNIGALIVFVIKGAIILPIAICMAAGAILGAQIGSRYAVRLGAKIIKPMLIFTCICMIGKLALQSFFD
jgi:uncharacterized protein